MITLSRFATIVTPVRAGADVKLNPGPEGKPPGGGLTGGVTTAGGEVAGVAEAGAERALSPPELTAVTT
jgi:hypothetical protein